MKLKNGQLIIYEVDKNYLKYLSSYDKNVRNKSKRRYTGIIVTNNNIDYCIPLTSTVKKRNPKLTVNIINKGETIAQLTINNMIPVNEQVLKIVDITKDKDKDYLNNEITFLRKNVDALLSKANNVYTILKRKPHHPDYNFFKQICADYQLLENKLNEYSKIKV